MKIAAPFVPFISDAIYQNLRTPDMPSLSIFAISRFIIRKRDETLEAAMAAVQITVSLGHVFAQRT